MARTHLPPSRRRLRTERPCLSALRRHSRTGECSTHCVLLALSASDHSRRHLVLYCSGFCPARQSECGEVAASVCRTSRQVEVDRHASGREYRSSAVKAISWQTNKLGTTFSTRRGLGLCMIKSRTRISYDSQRRKSAALPARPHRGNFARRSGNPDACIRMTRIPVWTLVQMKKLGRHEAELIEDFPGLTPSDLDAAWDYYRANTGEIDQAIAAEVSNVGDLRGQLLRVRRPAS
jgi:uncharacterized protein (DUF433 family)